ncbi:hypothetical protein BG20_I0777 [Candidatus Nitrosarchaeum limnium BG20]|uniref:Uncharacterized protein n=1 Tax=Candidatus Nitrosarchaeum limnium BG20 TaxID=859192 RepID=S2EMS7_9ARCH|nr:hypothetical protein BG20_I0777 [Candidatus Nitrosarchaeum limnium BG20]
MEHTKECEYRNAHDMIHANCFCKCHKIITMEAKKMDSKYF